MATPLAAAPAQVASAARSAARIGFPIALLLAGLAALAFALGIATPPRSGAFCAEGCTVYPYADAARYFPRDYFWMLPGILLTPLFTAVAACVYICVPIKTKVLALLALCASLVSTVLITLDYFVQILVVQPSLEHRQTDGVALFTQYNPTGMFIALEDLGYLAMSVAFLLLGAAISRAIRPGFSLRWTLLIAGLLGWTSFAGLGIRFGVDMGLPFELAIITIDWIALLVAGILLSIWFRNVERGPAS